MARNQLRDDLEGVSFSNDRLWRITGPNFVVGLTEYNDEITGFAPLLRSLFKNGAVCYSGNAYYVLNECRRRGWKVEEVEDRKCMSTGMEP
jgi:hypothetical protein